MAEYTTYAILQFILHKYSIFRTNCVRYTECKNAVMHLLIVEQHIRLASSIFGYILLSITELKRSISRDPCDSERTFLFTGRHPQSELGPIYRESASRSFFLLSNKALQHIFD